MWYPLVAEVTERLLYEYYINGLMQKWHGPIVNALEMSLFCINP